MKTLKYFDTTIQSIIILLTALNYIQTQHLLSFTTFYVVLGVWQPLFTLIYSVRDKKIDLGRKVYNGILIFMLLIILLFFVVFQINEEVAGQIGDFIMVTSPFIALYNYGLTIHEIKMSHKPHTVWDIE